MQQEGAIKLKTCNEMGGTQAALAASCNKILMRAATVEQLLQHFLHVLL